MSSSYSLFLSTPSARRATVFLLCLLVQVAISIHALREEGDLVAVEVFLFQQISIHALREEGDIQAAYDRRKAKISIHALREEGDAGLAAAWCKRAISIHALREEGDQGIFSGYGAVFGFLSTPSARRATFSW